MIAWESFDNIHVIRKLRHILHKWWNVDMLFFDNEGQLQGLPKDDKDFCSPFVCELLKKNSSKEEFLKTAKQVIHSFQENDENHYVGQWNSAGFDVAMIPIRLNNEFMGCVLATGFFKTEKIEKRLGELNERMIIFGSNKNVIQETIGKVRAIHGLDFDRFLEVLDLVSQEIITLHTEISSKDQKIEELSNQLETRYSYDNMIGKSKPMQELYSLLDKVQGTDSTVLIQGENGTGKELIARAIHYNSKRKKEAFIAQNCSAFNDNLLESELFGHVKGAFTSAVNSKKGIFLMADNGTFFLDEIGDTSSAMQVKLLRVLQEGVFLPIGATEYKKVDVRVIAASNKNLKNMVADGTFREDLYYRLNVIMVQVPPLRERKEDIPLLTKHFLKHFSKEKELSFSKEALEKLYNYHWPGNVRELQNEVERAVALSQGQDILTESCLTDKLNENNKKVSVPVNNMNAAFSFSKETKLKDTLEVVEKQMIEEGLKRTKWNKTQLAKELGVSRGSLLIKIDKYDIDKRRLPTIGSQGKK